MGPPSCTAPNRMSPDVQHEIDHSPKPNDEDNLVLVRGKRIHKIPAVADTDELMPDPQEEEANGQAYAHGTHDVEDEQDDDFLDDDDSEEDEGLDTRQLSLPQVPSAADNDDEDEFEEDEEEEELPPPPRRRVGRPRTVTRTAHAPARERVAAAAPAPAIDDDAQFCAYAMRIGADRARALLEELFAPYLEE